MSASSGDEDPPPQQTGGSTVVGGSKNHRISTPIIIGVSVGACVVVVVAMVAVFSLYHKKTRGRTRKMTMALERQQSH
jgi:hypothetical protein